MCFLCAISRWSRRVASMLPWLVIPFIIVWALSQLLPPTYRLEITSSRLACLSVLLLSLVWYELLMPWLSSWRAHRSAVLRERKLIEALEAAKRRKEATRRCRNCLTAYKIQMPGSGKYVCNYCGHISKRPVLEVAGTVANSRQIMLGSGTDAGMPHLRSSCQGNGPFAAWYKAAERNPCAWFGESSYLSDNCTTGRLFPAFTWRALLFVWREVLGIGKSTTDGSDDIHGTSENLDDASRSRLEKARRKADKKRQARLQKELLEAEDRKQREEVALLVEERRRQRDELEILKQKEREANSEKEKEIKKGGDSEKLVDKGNRKIGHPVTNASLDQGRDNKPGPVHKLVRETGDRVAASAGTLKDQVAESTTMSKFPRGPVHDQGSRYRSTMDSISRLSFLKRSGISTQKAFGSAPKMGVTPQNDGLLRSKRDSAPAGKATISSGSSSSSPRAAVVKHVPNSAWKRAPWISAWVKGSKGLADNNDSTQKVSFSENGKTLDQSIEPGFQASRNFALINKPSSSSVRGTAIQPPIAPPSIHVDPVQQLFSTPSLFSPMDLCAYSFEHQTETKGVFLPEHTFFEAQNFSQTTDSLMPSFGSPSLQMVSDTQIALPEPSYGSSFAQTNVVVPQPSLLSDTLYNGQPAFVAGPTVELPPFDASRASEVAGREPSIPSSLFSSKKVADLDACTDKDNFSAWECAHEEVLRLPPLSTEEYSFEMNSYTSEPCLLSPKKIGSLKVTEDTVLDGVPGSDQSSLKSPLDTSVRVWDDTDGIQKVPAEFVDCITQEIMEDPVITADGHSYERTAIEKWLKHHDTSPKTGEVLPPPPGGSGVDKTLRPNHILRGQIIEYKERLARMLEIRSMTWPISTRDAGAFFKTMSSPSVLSF